MIELQDWRENDYETIFKKCELLQVVLGIRRVGALTEVKIVSSKEIFVAFAPFQDSAIDRCFQLYMEFSSCPSA